MRTLARGAATAAPAKLKGIDERAQRHAVLLKGRAGEPICRDDLDKLRFIAAKPSLFHQLVEAPCAENSARTDSNSPAGGVGCKVEPGCLALGATRVGKCEADHAPPSSPCAYSSIFLALPCLTTANTIHHNIHQYSARRRRPSDTDASTRSSAPGVLAAPVDQEMLPAEIKHDDELSDENLFNGTAPFNVTSILVKHRHVAHMKESDGIFLAVQCWSRTARATRRSAARPRRPAQPGRAGRRLSHCDRDDRSVARG